MEVTGAAARRFTIASALLVLTVLAIGVGSPATAGAAAKPNIVVIMSDDQRADELSVMTKLKTSLRDTGVTFANSYVSYSLCCPSRTSFLTGQYMHNHDITWNFWPQGGYMKFKHQSTNYDPSKNEYGGWSNILPRWLQSAGYQTGLIGKYLNETGTEDPTTRVTKTAAGAAGSRTVTVSGGAGGAAGLLVGMRLSGHAGIPSYTRITAISGNTVTISKPLTKALSGTGNFVGGRSTETEIPPGWSEWYGGVDPTTYSYFGYTLNENGKLHRYGTCERVDAAGAATTDSLAGCKTTSQRGKDYTEYQTDVLATKAEDFIRRNSAKTKPFFLWVTPTGPHTTTATGALEGLPAVPPNRYANTFATASLPNRSAPSFDEADVSDKPTLNYSTPLGVFDWFPRVGSGGIQLAINHSRGRRGAIKGIDDMVGRIVTQLKASGKLANTIIVYTSDNGWLLGEHRIVANKFFGFEESIRVPLVISGPGFTGGKTETGQAVNVDLAPTILKAAGVTLSPGATSGRPLDGIPLQDLMANPSAWNNRTWAVETGPNPRSAYYAGAHNKRYHLEVITGGNGPTRYELYDLQTDPYELVNLAPRIIPVNPANLSAGFIEQPGSGNPKYTNVLNFMKAEVAKLANCKGSACQDNPPSFPEPTP